MSNTVSILNPVRRVELSTGGSVSVRELRALEALELFRKLSSHAGRLVDEKGNLSLNVARLTELITGTEDVATFLLLKSTQQDEAWLQQLGMSDAVLLLDAALELNLSEDLLKNVRQLGGRLTTAFGRMTPKGNTPSSSSTSLPTDT